MIAIRGSGSYITKMARVGRSFAATLLSMWQVLVLCALAPVVSSQPASRFTMASGCLETSPNFNTSCITCSVSVTVDSRVRSSDCSMNANLAGMVCNELESVLGSIARGGTRHRRNDCIEVRIRPRGEIYVVHGIMERIEQNVVLRAETSDQRVPVSISFANMDENMPTSSSDSQSSAQGPTYVLTFHNSFTVLSGLTFINSPGIIGFEDVMVVVIEKCSFRFFMQGAVDIYNCPTVLVSASNFSHNAIDGITKSQAYRGHSAGLSISQSVSAIGPFVRISNCSFLNNSVEATPIGVTIDPNDPQTNPDDGNNFNNTEENNNNNNNDDNNNKKPQPKQDTAERFDTRGQIFRDQVFLGRGGGMALILNSHESADVVVVGCEFTENVALEFGGGMYVLLQGLASHLFTISHCGFLGNVSPSSAGGLYLTFLTEGAESENYQVNVVDNVFFQNQATYGGGLFFLPLTLSVIENTDSPHIGVFGLFERCNFTENFATQAGGAVGVAFNLPSISQQQILPLEIRDCHFSLNSVNGAGIVSIANFPASFHGTNSFLENRGPSLAIIGSLVKAYGLMIFRDNTNINSLDGGAIYITSLGQLLFNPNTRILLRNNSGILGAGIVIRNIHVSNSALFRLAHNPLCAFLFNETTLPPDQWQRQNVSLVMVRNSARVSSGVNVNNIHLCSWRDPLPPRFDSSNAFFWNFISYIRNSNMAHGNPTERMFAVQTPPISITLSSGVASRRNRRSTLIPLTGVEAFPGQNIMMGIFARDELTIPTSAVVGLLDGSSNENQQLYSFTPDSLSLDRVDPMATVNVRFSLLNRGTNNFSKETITVRTIRSVDSLVDANANFDLQPLACPAGMVLPMGSGECMCEVGRADIVDCSGKNITLEDFLWGYSNMDLIDNDLQNESTFSGFLTKEFKSHPFHTSPCPSRYCRCEVTDRSGERRCDFVYNGEVPEQQCHCNRKGVLCGDCEDGLGFSALLNNCVSCDGRFTTLILALVVVNVIAVILLLVFMHPFAPWLHPIICYLQILPHFTNYFPVTFEKLNPYLFYISSALGLYFPYDFCLHSNMHAAGVYALRYIPTLVALLISPIILYIRLKKFPRDWHGLWWLVLLLYTPLLHTSVTLLHCPALKGDSTFTPRWYINGNIRCFQDAAHAPLGLFAIVVLFCGVAMVPLVILIALNKLTRPYWIHNLVTPLTLPYKKEYAWWCGVELGKRLVFVIFAITLNTNDYGVIFFLVILLTFTGFLKPYKNMLVNILDIVFLGDIFVLLSLRNTAYLEDVMQVIPRDGSMENETGIEYLNGTCSSEVPGITNFVALLASFYYFPVLLALIVFFIWICWKVHSLIVNDCMPKMKKSKEANSDIVSSYSVEETRKRTQTVVDMTQCQEASPALSSKVNNQFKLVQKPHIRLASRRKSKIKVSSSLDNNRTSEAVPMKDLSRRSSSMKLKHRDKTDSRTKLEQRDETNSRTKLEQRDETNSRTKPQKPNSPLIASTTFDEKLEAEGTSYI